MTTIISLDRWGAPASVPAINQNGADEYIGIGAASIATAVGGVIYGLPERDHDPQATWLEEAKLPRFNRAGSVTSGPDTGRARVVQFARIAGLKGTSTPPAKVTASGKATRTYRFDSIGLCPSERGNAYPESSDYGTSEREVRMLRRYRDLMKGDKFAASMANERAARHTNVMRANSVWPFDEKHSRFYAGVQIGADRYFDCCDSTLSQLVEFNKAQDADNIAGAAERMSREVELAALIAEQDADARAQRKGKILES
jgi:hypothetical protein